MRIPVTICLTSFLFLLFALNSFAQSKVADTTIYEKVELEASFPGGIAA